MPYRGRYFRRALQMGAFSAPPGDEALEDLLDFTSPGCPWLDNTEDSYMEETSLMIIPQGGRAAGTLATGPLTGDVDRTIAFILNGMNDLNKNPYVFYQSDASNGVEMWLDRSAGPGSDYVVNVDVRTGAGTSLTATGFGTEGTFFVCYLSYDTAIDTWSLICTGVGGTATDTAVLAGGFGAAPYPIEFDQALGPSAPDPELHLDSIGIWDRVLTAGDRTEYENAFQGRSYNTLTPGLLTGLLHWYDCKEQGVDDTRADSHGSDDYACLGGVTYAKGVAVGYAEVGDLLSAWNSRSGSSPFVNGATVSRPVRAFKIVGSTGKKRVVTFNGSSQFLTQSTGFCTTPAGYSLYLVWFRGNPSGPPGVTPAMPIWTDSTPGTGYRIRITARTGLFDTVGGALTVTYGGVETEIAPRVGGTPTPGTWSLTEVHRLDSGDHHVWINGVDQTPVVPGTDAHAGVQWRQLMSSGVVYAEGEVAEVFLADSELSPSDKADIRGYFITKYGL